jgi:hypothetical protein
MFLFVFFTHILSYSAYYNLRKIFAKYVGENNSHSSGIKTSTGNVESPFNLRKISTIYTNGGNNSHFSGSRSPTEMVESTLIYIVYGS